MQKLQVMEKHINKCGDVRRIRDWRSVLREVDAAVAAGADSSPQVNFFSLFVFVFHVICELDMLWRCEIC